MSVFQDCYTTKDFSGRTRTFLDRGKVADLLGKMGFEVEGPRIEGNPYKYSLGDWHIWKCVHPTTGVAFWGDAEYDLGERTVWGSEEQAYDEQGRLLDHIAWATARYIDNRIGDHLWFICGSDDAEALESAVKRALGLTSEFRWIPEYPGFSEGYRYYIASGGCDGWRTDGRLMSLLIEDLQNALDDAALDDDELCALERKGWEAWVDYLFVDEGDAADGCVEVAQFDFDTWTWV